MALEHHFYFHFIVLTGRPSSKPFHNCPQYVAVGDHLSCTCSGHDLGDPPGVLQWNSTPSTQLTISNVQSSDSKTYNCQLLWNNTLEQFEKYTLNLGCEFRILLNKCRSCCVCVCADIWYFCLHLKNALNVLLASSFWYEDIYNFKYTPSNILSTFLTFLVYTQLQQRLFTFLWITFF